MSHVLIIGNGIAGVTAARHIRKLSDDDITIISGETEYFYSRPALMYIYMGHMTFDHTKPHEDWFWEKNRIARLRDYVTRVDTESKKVELLSGIVMPYDVLIIASGSASNKFGWPGQDLRGVQGLYSMQDLELMEQNTQDVEHAVIVGGGLIGIEVAEMLDSRSIPVSFLVREKEYWDNVLPAEEAAMVSRHVREHGVDLRLQTELKEILPDANGRVRAVRSNQDEEIACQFVALTAGVHPNIDFLRSSAVDCNRGVLVNDYLETNVADVYAIGDCAEIIVPDPEKRNRIEQLWYTGKMHGEVVAHTICGTRSKYERGILFNSAKFFDIEYHTYGLVNFNTPGEKNLYWEHPDGKRSIRIVYNDKAVIGFNTMGIRYRHSTCERWLREERPIDYVLAHLDQANFDPEFYELCEPAVLNLFEQQNPGITIAKRKGRGILSSIFA